MASDAIERNLVLVRFQSRSLPSRTRNSVCYTAPMKFETAVAQNTTIAGIIRAMGWGKPNGTLYRRFRRLVAERGLDISHMTGQSWSGGQALPTRRRPLTDYFVKQGPFITSSRLRRRLIAEGLKSCCCEECGLEEWLGRPIPLELDHINGDPSDNRLENLRILCANCHALTPTWSHRNVQLRPEPPKCKDCGKRVSRKARRCRTCSLRRRNSRRTTVNWPPTKTLLQMVQKSGYAPTARTLGCSDNAVRKRLKREGATLT